MYCFWKKINDIIAWRKKNKYVFVVRIYALVYIYTIKVKIIKIFSHAKIRPTVHLTEVPLIRAKGLTKRVETHFLIEEKCFYRKLIVFTPTIFYTHLLYPCITFFWHTLYFSLYIPIICVIICFGRIIIDIIILQKEKKDAYIFGRKINDIAA